MPMPRSRPRPFPVLGLVAFVSVALAAALAATAAPAPTADGATAAIAGVAGVDDAHARISPSLDEMDAWGEHGRKAKIMLILFQVAAMLVAAKLLGWLAERVKVPGVIGELMAGVLIGPYLLGNLISIPLGAGHAAPLFPAPVGTEWPVNDVVWTFAQIASIVLLFVTGLHTDLKQFLKYVGPATLVAVAGLLIPFALGAAVVYVPTFSRLAVRDGGDVMVAALFVGAILAATSIGITARVLGDIGKLDTAEGVTILGAAVLDDVLGIIALAVVGGIAAAKSGVGEALTAGGVLLIAGKAFGFWIGLTVVVLLSARHIERLIGRVNYSGAMVGLGLALAMVCSGAAESVGLAFIIGAYSVGLGLSRTKLAHKLMEALEPVGDFFVPIFFAALGMLVNVWAMFASWQVVLFGLTVTAAAIVGKLIGCGAAALPGGFNLRGAYRIGLGMLPRGEVALIVAGIGLSSGMVGQVVFGVSIMMTLITTVVAPILLVPAFARGGPGRRRPEEPATLLPPVSVQPAFEMRLPRPLCKHFIDVLLETAERGGWDLTYENSEEETYLFRRDSAAAEVSLRGETIHVDATDALQHEWSAFVSQVRQRLVAELEGATLTVCPAGDAVAGDTGVPPVPGNVIGG
jgi:Kef-type K+ transport system membrane component KefB